MRVGPETQSDLFAQFVHSCFVKRINILAFKLTVPLLRSRSRKTRPRVDLLQPDSPTSAKVPAHRFPKERHRLVRNHFLVKRKQSLAELEVLVSFRWK